jgi:glycosyltransferase involved in cell wall biosynthesis
MKIFIPYQPFAVGGPISFLAKFRKEVESRGHQILTNFRPDFNVLLAIESCPLWYIAYAKLHRKRIVQRLDGVYHSALPGLNGYFYWFKNIRLQILHNFLADQIVYQSSFAQDSCQTMLGKPRGETSIIYNGVDIPSPRVITPRLAIKPVKLITVGKFRRRDQITPIIAAVRLLRIPYEFHIYGPHTKNLRQIFTSFASSRHIHYHGPAAHQDIREALDHCDIFLFSDQSACPNAVLEALAAGLPVVAYNRGSIPELIKSGQGGQVVPVRPHNPWYDPYEFIDEDATRLANAIVKVAHHLNRYRELARQTAHTRFSLETMVSSYLEVFSRQ